jgi:hypothetical protein
MSTSESVTDESSLGCESSGGYLSDSGCRRNLGRYSDNARVGGVGMDLTSGLFKHVYGPPYSN